MAENIKTPPDQDPRQRTPQGDPNKPQKPGSPGPSVGSPDRNRTGGGAPGKPGSEMDPDRDMPDRDRVQKPMPGSGKPGADKGADKKDGDIGADITELDDDDDEMPVTQRQGRPGIDDAP
jgi:hypothetical protein